MKATTTLGTLFAIVAVVVSSSALRATRATEQPVLEGVFQAASAVKVCALLPKAEVKKLIGANDAFDSVEPTEKPLNNGGASCAYGRALMIMVHSGTLDGMKRPGAPTKAVPDVGDEAYVYNNPAGSVDLSVKVGPRLLTISRELAKDGRDSLSAVQPGVVALAKALVPKLR